MGPWQATKVLDTADYRHGGKEPRFWTHLETSTILDPKSTRSADLLDAEYSEYHGNEKNFEKFLKEKGPAGIDTINLNRCDIWFYSSSLMLPFYSLFASRCLLYSPARKPFMLRPLYWGRLLFCRSIGDRLAKLVQLQLDPQLFHGWHHQP